MKKITNFLTKSLLSKSSFFTLAFLMINLIFVENLSAQIAQVGSSQSNTTTGTTITINKPSGLAIGHVMIANIVQSDNDNATLSNATRTNWLLIDGKVIGTNGGDEWWGTLLYKIADATDVAASNFAFTLDSDTNGDGTVGAIVAFSGVDISGGFNATGNPNSGPFALDPGTINTSGDVSTVTATSITTVNANDAVMMFAMVGNDRNFSNWQTATGPMTLNELYDIDNNTTLDNSIGAAWATKAIAGSTGTGTSTLTTSARNGGILIALKRCAPSITTQPLTQTVCDGSALNLSVVAVNATSYQWKKGGVSIGGQTTNSYSIPTVSVGDAGSYTVDVINSCQTITSNAAVVSVNAVLASSVSISTATTTVCAGTNVTFTATPTNGGTATYQWKVNGSNVGSNSTTYSTTTLTNGSLVTCTMTSSTPCLTGLPAVSNTLTMTVNPNLPANIVISATTTAICEGENVIFTAVATNGGASPIYQWKINGSDVGTDSATYASTTLLNGESVTCVLTSNASPCLTGSPDTSNPIVMIVNSFPSVVNIIQVDQVVCEDAITYLNTSGGIVTNGILLNENFNAVSNNWITENTSSGGTVADAAWKLRPNGYNYNFGGAFNSNDASQFYLSNSDDQGSGGTTRTRLISPTFSLDNLTSASLSFYHYYRYNSGSESAKVQISTDNGATWGNPDLASYTSTQGARTTFALVTINLTSYVGFPNVKIRFNYLATNDWYWAIDNVTVTGTGTMVTWSPQAGLYTDSLATIAYTGEVTTSVYAKLSSNTVFTATSTTPSNCSVSDMISLTVNPNVTYYRDFDNDTYGNPLNIRISCLGQPVGFVLNNTDCNDNNAALFTTFPFFLDTDKDGFGVGNLLNVCAIDGSTPPLGYALNNTDCNDANPMIYQTATFFIDADADGYDNGSSLVCYGASTPVGYATTTNGNDCDDLDNTKHETFLFYLDSDLDGFGTGSLVSACAVDALTSPTGYSLNNTDCDDLNILIYQTGALFVDSDNDGYTSGATASVCYGLTAPSGYALTNIGIDCNDLVMAINPGQSEVLFNGVDDNCDGNLDENFQIKTQVLIAHCGTTMVSIGSLIGATTLNLNNVTGYRFRVTNQTTNSVQTIDMGVPHFSLNQLPLYDYATTYSIAIELQISSVWLGYYGDSCLVSSPAILAQNGAAQVSPSQCGITLSHLGTLVVTTSLPGVTGYRFRISNITPGATGPNLVQVINRNFNWFSLTMLSRFNYGTIYTVEVAVKTNGDYSGYGNPCEISSPNSPSLVNCGGVIASPATLVAATSLPQISQFRFQVTRISDNSTSTIDRNLNWFTFNQVPGYSSGEAYGVRVAVMTSGEWSPFGDACEITAPGVLAPRFAANTPLTNEFKAVASPNPFAANFKLELSGSSIALVNLKVYDMIGKLVDSREMTLSEMSDQEIGNNYPSGVYNVVISQEDKTKTLRMVKR